MIESSKEWIFLGDAIWLIASNGEESPSPEYIESNWDRAARALFDAIDGRETEAEPQGYRASDRVHVPLPTGIWHRMNGDNELKDPFFTPLDPEEKRETRGMISIHGNGKWYGCRIRRDFLLQFASPKQIDTQQAQPSNLQKVLENEDITIEPMVRDVLERWGGVFPTGAPAKAGTRNELIQNDYKRRGATPPGKRTIEKAAAFLKRVGEL
ncbi:hypothetical protein [Mesorhizobium sp. GR13]|uniref:hypothetical protein n=1 Tax=Mesorhizobium sp. GR13 TaxID=2562308 RepID=UPI0010C13F4E|nr:hypothetical protein [Mesorhizobium sp. GR13]